MEKIKSQIIETGKWIMEKQLTWGTSGNISARDGERIYVTASGTVMGDLKEEDIIVCALDGRVLDGAKKPSKETTMHVKVYQNCPDVQGIIHTSPFYSTFCACTDLDLKTNLFIESMYYDETIERIPYYHAGSRELAEAVADVCTKSHVILMEHHGILVYDKSLSECRTALDVTENVCKMNVLARSAGIALCEIEPETVKDFLEGGYYKKRRA
ncbi:class II aldolase/adducin family protein [Brotaphodocola sp.]|uniref:class II aldolase/adducin family protein n=1 Tax=Brotaphodocola sp. TaxID=3073577 RepID=UPI003D7D9C97